MRNHGTRKKQRIRLFERGNTRCPICLVPFTRQDVEREDGSASLEDVPAKSLGRAIAMCLTCRSCNSRTGRVEQAVADSVHAERRGGEKVTLTPSASPGQPQSARMTVKPNGDIVAVLPENTRVPPEEFMKAMTAGEITIQWRAPSSKAARMPWLKAAYLSVFSLLGTSGYRYAEGAAIRQIRRQILEPGEEIIPYFVLSGVGPHPKWPRDGIHMDRVGGHWMVKIGDRLIPLPTSSDERLYERLSREWMGSPPPQDGLVEITYTTSDGPLWYPVKFGDVVTVTGEYASDVAFASTGRLSRGTVAVPFIVADSRDQVLTLMHAGRLG